MADHSDHDDRVLCHACGAVWLKLNDGLTCPQCGSEFTEIVRRYSVLCPGSSTNSSRLQIEIPPDNASPEPHIERDSPPTNPWETHNPWPQEDLPRAYGFMGSSSPSSPRYSQHTYRSPDGRFVFSSTSVRGGFSTRQANAQPNPTVPMIFEGLDSIFQTLANTGHNQRAPRGAAAMDHFDSEPHGIHEYDDPPESFPREPDAPQPTAHPVGLVEYVSAPGRRARMLEALAADTNHHARLLESFRRDYAPRPGTAGANPLANPLAMLSVLLNMDRNGDAVYSQEELDRVISELIDHNATGNAPPGASTTAIQSLPKKKVDEQMLGSDGSAECSICMDMVELGTEVTVLPCTHWFHFTCIEAWLIQHNTCPHCRRSIDSASATPGTTGNSTSRTHGDGTSENPVVIPDSPEIPSPRRRRRSSPFASLSGRSSFSRSSRQSQAQAQAPATPDPNGSGTRRSSGSSRNSRNEGSRGGFTDWVWGRFGGGNN
ncbi:RING finger domain protein [Penicillium sp. IBT 16267x]|nr:RING finger domain protein [Penicillium sp. IBT 16267x]